MSRAHTLGKEKLGKWGVRNGDSPLITSRLSPSSPKPLDDTVVALAHTQTQKADFTQQACSVTVPGVDG